MIIQHTVRWFAWKR